MTDEQYMKAAQQKAHEGVEKGQSPFGALIVKRGEILSCGHNQVLEKTDITAHAEVITIREACRKIRSIDLSGSIIYSTCEPCPMCFTAIHWAKISKIIFGARIEDAEGFGFSELKISNCTMKELGLTSIEIKGDFLREESLKIFQGWSKRTDRRVY